MAAAVRDYKAELLADEAKGKAAQRAANEQQMDLLEDEDLDELHAQRIKEMKQEAMRRLSMQRRLTMELDGALQRDDSRALGAEEEAMRQALEVEREEEALKEAFLLASSPQLR